MPGDPIPRTLLADYNSDSAASNWSKCAMASDTSEPAAPTTAVPAEVPTNGHWRAGGGGRGAYQRRQAYRSKGKGQKGKGKGKGKAWW